MSKAMRCVGNGLKRHKEHRNKIEIPDPDAYKDLVKFRGGGLNDVLYGEAPPRGPTPYPFIDHFGRKGNPFIYLLLKKGTPFTYLF